MSNHLLALAIKPVDFARSIGGGVQLRNSLQAQGQQSELRGLKIDALRQGNASNALIGAARVDAFDVFQGGTPEQQRAAIMRLGALDPKEAASVQQLVANADDRQRAALAEMSEDLARAAMFADTPEKWDAAVDHLSEKYPDVAKLKGQFSPEARLKAIRSAMSLHDAIADALPTPSDGFRRSRADPARQEFIPGSKADPATIRAQAAARRDPNAGRPTLAQTANNRETFTARDQLRDLVGEVPPGMTAREMIQGKFESAARRGTAPPPFLEQAMKAAMQHAVGDDATYGDFIRWLDTRTPEAPEPPREPDRPGILSRTFDRFFGGDEAEAAEPFDDRLNRVQGDLRGRGSAGQGGDVLAQARRAIEQGAPRAAVERRLREAGIDPGLL